MKVSELKTFLDPATLSKIESVYEARKEKMGILLRLLANNSASENMSLVNQFCRLTSFRSFLRKTASISQKRFSNRLQIIIEKLMSSEDCALIDRILRGFCSKEFRQMEKLFFTIPPDKISFSLFERESMSVWEHAPAEYHLYASFFESVEFGYFRAGYLNELALYDQLFRRLTGIFLGTRIVEKMRFAAEVFSENYTLRLIKSAEVIEQIPECITSLHLILAGNTPSQFFSYLSVIHKRYPALRASGEGEGDTNKVTEIWFYLRIKHIWNFLTANLSLTSGDFRKFVFNFGDMHDEYENLVWNLVFDLKPDKAARAIEIILSPAFFSTREYFSNDKEIIGLLIKNIVVLISEMRVRNIPLNKTITDTVLNLIINIKVDRNFIKRRAAFLTFLNKSTPSRTIENEVIRIMIIEYIYIATGAVKNSIPLIMSKALDESHLFFIKHIDNTSLASVTKKKQRNESYQKVINRLRDMIWRQSIPYLNKYEYSEKIKTLCSIAAQLDSNRDIRALAADQGMYSFEDAIITSLVGNEESSFESYFAELYTLYRNKPERCIEAVVHDFWCRVYLSQALAFCSEITLPLIGMIPIYPSVGGVACTDGKSIFLPEYISKFKDSRDNLRNNRNITFYGALTLHEAGHIAGGSFHYDIRNILVKLEHPKLYRIIVNYIEDYRIEQLVISLNIHSQAKELLDFCNIVSNANMIGNRMQPAQWFLFYIVTEADGTIEPVRKSAHFKKHLESFYALTINTGRFASVRSMTDNTVLRIKNMNLWNPLESYKIAMELYLIILHWPDIYLENTGSRNRFSDNDASAQISGGRPLTLDQLDEYYRECNRNPREFLRDQGFREIADDEYARKPDEILELSEFNYEDNILIDSSTRTAVDDLVAENQLCGAVKPEVIFKKGKKRKRKVAERVYSLDPSTESRTKLSEIRTYYIDRIDNAFLEYFEKYEYMVDSVHKMLSRVIPEIQGNLEMSMYEGEANMELLLEYLIMKGGSAVYPEFFEEFREEKCTIEVFIGIDISGSTACEVSREAGGKQVTVLDIEKSFALILAISLKHLTPEVTVAAFNSFTSTNVYIAEPFEAISSLQPDQSNRDGDFIRYATDYLLQSGADEKFFFLLSDGHPNAENYEGKEAMDDTLHAMRECVSAGIKLAYFNCDSERGEYFECFQKEATFARYFSSPEQLISVIPEFVSIVAKVMV